MTKDQQIQDHFNKLKESEIQTFPAKVMSVNKDQKVIEVKDLHGIEYDARLSAIVADGDKIVMYPKPDTWVLVSIINNQENILFVSAFSVVEEVEGKIESTEYIINKEGFFINRGGKNLFTIMASFFDLMQNQNKKIQDVAKELAKVVVSIGVTPNVPAIEAIIQLLEQINETNNQIKEDLNIILKA